MPHTKLPHPELYIADHASVVDRIELIHHLSPNQTHAIGMTLFSALSVSEQVILQIEARFIVPDSSKLAAAYICNVLVARNVFG